MTALKDQAKTYFESLQDQICEALERLDGEQKFKEDRWVYAPENPSKGGGITRVIEGGKVFEKGGVNTSALIGHLSEKLAERLEVPPCPFFATGISLVLHPRSPFVPTVHMNLRFLEMDLDREGMSWFGGGADLTPHYLDRKDAAHFHHCYLQACDAHDPEYYPKFKQWCDEYFYIRHRDETRGVGGVFFDYLKGDLGKTFAFIQSVGKAFLPSYEPIVKKHKDRSWSEREEAWLKFRRGRYVEFNLVYDRGTLFGLETKGRTESILMSLPPRVEWRYDYHPEPGSQEASLVEALKSPVDWAKEYVDSGSLA